MAANEELIRKAVCQTFGKDSNDPDISYSLKKHATGGFLSSVQFLTVTKANGQKFDAVVKFPDICKMAQHYHAISAVDAGVGVDFVTEAHDTEVSFLNCLGKFKANSAQLEWLPAVYAAKSTKEEEGTYILMEDLSSVGKTPDDIQPLPESVLESTIDALADIAVLSIDKKNVLSEVVPFSAIHGTFVSDVKLGLEYLSSHFGEDFPVSSEAVLKQFDLGKYLEFIGAANPHPIPVHRDVFPRNILVERGDETKFVSILDWQLGGIGRPGEDLARLFTTSLDAEARRRKTEYFLKFYFEKVEEKCEKSQIELNFTFEDVKTGYDGAFAYNVLLFCDVGSLCLQAGKEQLSEEQRLKLVDRIYGCVKDAFDV